MKTHPEEEGQMRGQGWLPVDISWRNKEEVSTVKQDALCRLIHPVLLLRIGQTKLHCISDTELMKIGEVAAAGGGYS
jgi:hypothetical protein